MPVPMHLYSLYIFLGEFEKAPRKAPMLRRGFKNYSRFLPRLSSEFAPDQRRQARVNVIEQNNSGVEVERVTGKG